MLENLLYAAALTVLSPVILYRMLRHGRYRRGIRQKFLGLSTTEAQVMTQGKRCVWIHAVSVGEVNLLPRLVKELERDAAVAIVVSTSTDTGYDLAVQHFGSRCVFFCPLDFTWAVRRTLRNLKPLQLVLAELELWPNLVRMAAVQGCPAMIINGRLSERSSAGYQRFRKWTKSIFRSIHWVACQDEMSRSNFAACGTPAERLQVTGSLKFDDAPTDRTTPEVNLRRRWAGGDATQRVWVVGSTQEGEEEMAIEAFQSLRVRYPELRLMLVPRHKERFEKVAGLVTAAGLLLRRRSDETFERQSTWNSDQVILIDTIGELRHWWGVADIATVGGRFGDRGGQNMLEPAGYGCAVSFGPNTRNFKEIARRLLDAKGAVRLQDGDELMDFVHRCLSEQAFAVALGHAAQQVVLEHRGAFKKTVARLQHELKQQFALDSEKHGPTGASRSSGGSTKQVA